MKNINTRYKIMLIAISTVIFLHIIILLVESYICTWTYFFSFFYLKYILIFYACRSVVTVSSASLWRKHYLSSLIFSSYINISFRSNDLN